MSKNHENPPKPKTAASPDEDEHIPEIGISLLHSIANGLARADKPKVGESSPDLGMAPLFPSARDIASAERAYAKTLELLEAEKIDIIGLDWLKSKLTMIAQSYWVEHERDNRLSSSDMKQQVALLQRDLAKVIKRLGELPLATRQVLNAGVRSRMPKQIGPGPNHVAELHKRGNLLHDACGPLSTKQNTRVRRSFRFQRCSANLSALRERLTGKPIASIFELEKGDFTTADAAFIHSVMKAIDDKVTESNVQDGLRRAAQEKNKRK